MGLSGDGRLNFIGKLHPKGGRSPILRGEGMCRLIKIGRTGEPSDSVTLALSQEGGEAEGDRREKFLR